MVDKNDYNILTFHDAQGAAVRVLVLMATDIEYGAELKSLGVRPAIIGVGPINAAINTTVLLKDLEQQGLLPDLVVNMGSAGSRELEYKTIAQASSVSYRDMDARPFGFAQGETPYSDLPAHLPIQVYIPGLDETTVSTGGNVVSGKSYDGIGAQTAEMEAYAIYSACLKFGIPMIKIVGISDGKKELTGSKEEWTQYLEDIDRGLAGAVATLKENLENGVILKKDLCLPERLQKKPKSTPPRPQRNRQP